jgi:hypothetical protein
MKKVYLLLKIIVLKIFQFQRNYHHQKRKSKNKKNCIFNFLNVLYRYILFASGFLLSETSVIFNQLEYLVNSLTQPTNIQLEKLKFILSNTIRFVVAGNLIENSNRLKDSTNQVSFYLLSSTNFFINIFRLNI